MKVYLFTSQVQLQFRQKGHKFAKEKIYFEITSLAGS